MSCQLSRLTTRGERTHACGEKPREKVVNTWYQSGHQERSGQPVAHPNVWNMWFRSTDTGA
eukprot:673783-Pyramimonas_sp.AAC.1